GNKNLLPTKLPDQRQGQSRADPFLRRSQTGSTGGNAPVQDLPPRLNGNVSGVGFNSNPVSAVAIDRKREAESLRSNVDGFLPLTRHRSAVLAGNAKLMTTTCEDAKMTLHFTVGRLRCSRIPPRSQIRFKCGIRAQCRFHLSEATEDGTPKITR